MGEEKDLQSQPHQQQQLILPELSVNLNGWGPSMDGSKLVNGMPFTSFNKADRLGMVST